MRFATALLAAFSALTSLVVGQTVTSSSSASISTGVVGNPNPISYPLGGTINAGTDMTITWSPTSGSSVDLALRQGAQANLVEVLIIATGIPNSGSYVWSIAEDLVTGDDYSIQIISGADSNYSPPFGIDSYVKSLTSSSKTSTTTSTSSATSTSATMTASITGSSNSSSSSTMRTSSTARPTATPSSVPDGEATIINSGFKIASPLVLISCIIAGFIYLN